MNAECLVKVEVMKSSAEEECSHFLLPMNYILFNYKFKGEIEDGRLELG